MNTRVVLLALLPIVTVGCSFIMVEVPRPDHQELPYLSCIETKRVLVFAANGANRIGERQIANLALSGGQQDAGEQERAMPEVDSVSSNDSVQAPARTTWPNDLGLEVGMK